MDYELSPKFHTIIEFPELKFEDLMGVFQDIYETTESFSKIIVLTKNDEVANWLSFELTKLDFSVSPVLGKRKARKNKRAIDGFGSGKFDVLIVSSSKMGMETGDVAHFINYDVALPSYLSTLRKPLRKRRHA